MRLKKQTGDTIVEVLIAIVVITTILAGAYVSSRRSLNSTFRSRERDEAVKLAQSQIELIRANINDAKDEVEDFCVQTDGSIVRYDPGFNLPTNLNSVNTSIYNKPECIRTNQDAEYDPSDPSQNSFPHYVSVLRNPTGGPSPDAQNLYLVTVRWARYGGGFDQTRIYYRMY